MSATGTKETNSLYRLFESRIERENGISAWTFSRVANDILTIEVEPAGGSKSFHLTMNPNLMSDLEHAMEELDHYFIRMRNSN